MKKRRKEKRSRMPLILFIVIVLLLVGFLYFYLNQPTPSILSFRAPSPTPIPSRIPYAKTVELIFNSVPYSIILTPLEATQSMTLIPNFKNRKFPDDIAIENDCMIAINGGFYTGSRNPLGLFYTQNELIGKYVKSGVANGFFAQNKLGQRMIFRDAPNSMDGFDFVMQSGPFIPVINRRMSLVADERARRSLVGVDMQGTIYLISIRVRESSYGGPNLADIPIIFSLSEVQKEASLSTLLNLDGGGASFFYSNDETDAYLLPALSPVGSVLCVTNPSNEVNKVEISRNE